LHLGRANLVDINATETVERSSSPVFCGKDLEGIKKTERKRIVLKREGGGLLQETTDLQGSPG
jgi:hypothetical protein